jgi:hypothetical protein
MPHGGYADDTRANRTDRSASGRCRVTRLRPPHREFHRAGLTGHRPPNPGGGRRIVRTCTAAVPACGTAILVRGLLSSRKGGTVGHRRSQSSLERCGQFVAGCRTRRTSWAALACFSFLAAGCGEDHPRADVGLVPLADHGAVIAGADDCRDDQGVAYTENAFCTTYILLQTPAPETDATFLSHEASVLTRGDWRPFPAVNEGFTRSAQGWTDRGGRDCLVLGSPQATLVYRHNLFLLVDPQGPYWPALLRSVRLAERQRGGLLGLVLTPGPTDVRANHAC